MSMSAEYDPMCSSAVSPIGAKMRQMYRQTTPDFKSVLREKCRSRIRENRSRLFNEHRGNVGSDRKVHFSDNVLAHEWNTMKEMISSEDVELDRMVNIYDEIQRELREEEELMIKQYLDLYEKDMENLIPDDSAICVLCPVCQKCNLMQNQAAIFCHCGLRIDNLGIGINLEQLQKNIFHYTTAHEYQCSIGPSFYVDSTAPDTPMLMMVCTGCDFMAVIV